MLLYFTVVKFIGVVAFLIFLRGLDGLVGETEKWNELYSTENKYLLATQQVMIKLGLWQPILWGLDMFKWYPALL